MKPVSHHRILRFDKYAVRKCWALERREGIEPFLEGRNRE